MKYKVGDKVRIKSLNWYNKNKDKIGMIEFSHDMKKNLGKIANIMSINHINYNLHYYSIDIDNEKYAWTDEMLEDAPIKQESILDKTSFVFPINWEQRRYELTKAAMQGMISNWVEERTDKSYANNISNLCKMSIDIADTMIKELKNNKEL